MRSPPPGLAPIAPNPVFHATPDPEDSHSSSSNSPARGDYEESDFFAGNNDSQSSIGVPTFQDMAVSEEECQPPIARLPAEVLIQIFSKLSNNPADLLNCMCVSKVWARNSVDLLWHRPACTTWLKHGAICRTLTLKQPYFTYNQFVKRLNLSTLADRVNDGSVMPLTVCNKVERLTLTNCEGITDHGLTNLVAGNENLLALDISSDRQITELSIFAVAENCSMLQGLNISSCDKISNESLITLAKSCKKIKRLKLNDCHQVEDTAVMAFAMHCPNILEIDLHQCRLVKDEPITALLTHGRSLRELRLAGCDQISDYAFLSLPSHQTYEHLRILDLTSCARLTDRAVERIIETAPRLRNLVLAKCRALTDAAVNAIAKLRNNLHYVHLGHCSQLTDAAVIKLVQSCNRIRYIDLGCCHLLTDNSVMKLASLPKLRRVGLVKCSQITDNSVYALAQAGPKVYQSQSSSNLERVHLSYCTQIKLQSIIMLLNRCPRLTHLSLTGVQAFLREDLDAFCREAPQEFTEHQRNVFCVFSGQGVVDLRNYLNNEASMQTQAQVVDAEDDDDTVNGADAEDGDDDQTMTGMMNAAAITAVEDDGDEELEDADGGQNDGEPLFGPMNPS